MMSAGIIIILGSLIVTTERFRLFFIVSCMISVIAESIIYFKFPFSSKTNHLLPIKDSENELELFESLKESFSNDTQKK
jgi:hypothetical protein